jgi:hypothetical protein
MQTTLEADLYGPILLAASRRGARLFRNHVGVSEHENGNKVRHGLPKGSADLIGWTADGRFLAVEVKRPGWRPSPKWRASSQAAFIEQVRLAGGVAGVATSVEDALALLDGAAS